MRQPFLPPLYLVIVLFLCSHTAIGIGNIFTVDNTGDSGAGTLRQAIIDANAIGTTSGDPHIIDFTVEGQIDLLTELPDVNNHITFNAHPNGNIIHNASALADFRLLEIGNYTVVLNNMVLSNGVMTADESGLALQMLAGGNLTLNNCVVKGSRATVSGGRYAVGMYLVNVTASINNTTFYDNTAERSGGYGGGLTVNGGSAILTNVTIAGSISDNGAGLFVWDATVDLINCTLVDNSINSTGADAIRVQGGSAVLNMTNTMVANNTGGTEAIGLALSGSIATNTNNLVEGTCTGGCPSFDYTSDPNLGIATVCGLQTHYPVFSPSEAINNGTSVGAPSDDICGASWNNPSAPNIGSSAETIIIENALDFDGVDDVVTTGANLIPDAGDFTVEVWARYNGASNEYREILSQGGGNFYLGHSNTGTIRAGDSWGGGNTGVTYPDDGEWHHFAVVKSSLTTKLYVDGVEQADLGSPISNTTNADFRIGSQFTGSEIWNGQIDEVRVWNVARTQAEISNNLGKTIHSATGLVASYDFNEGIPDGDNTGLTILPDKSGNANDGTLSGFDLSGSTSNWVASTITFPTGAVISNSSEGVLSTASTGGLTVTDNGFLSDIGDKIEFDYISNSTNGSFINEINTNVVDSRWERDWFIAFTDVGNNGGLATFTFDFDAAGVGGTPSGKYALLYRSNTASQYTVLTVNSKITGNTVSFSGDLLEASNGYYTLGSLTTVNASRLYVNEKAGGTKDGRSWTNALTELETALAIAGNDVEIWVAEGVYTPSDFDREASFRIDGQNNITLYGGFMGNEISSDDRNPDTYRTILSGDLAHNDVDDNDPMAASRSENSLHVVYVTGSTGFVIDGFVVTGGNANDNGVSQGNNGGGLITFSSIEIRNCTFEQNSSTNEGAGVWTFTGNNLIVGTKFRENKTNGNGGGLQTQGAVKVFNCWFENNSAVNGGAVFANGVGSSGIFANTIAILNNADNEGGAFYLNGTSTPSIINNTIYNNGALDAGGIYIASNSGGVIKNNIITGNMADSHPDMNHLGSADIDFNLFTYETIGANDVIGDPVFADENNFDFSLKSGSAAINKGQTSALPADIPDFDGDANTTEPIPFDFNYSSFAPRVLADIVDMGAIESNAAGGEGAFNALDFDGVDDYVSLTRTALPTGLTYEAWINTSSVAASSNYNGNPALTIIGDHDNAIRGAFGVHNGVVRYTHWTGSGDTFDVVDGTTSVNDGSWHHVAVTHDQSTKEVIIYVDGVEDARTTSLQYYTNVSFDRVGSSYLNGVGNAEYFQGQLDEVRIWNQSLTQFDIQSNMYNTLDAVSYPALVAYFQFNETTGTVLPDLTPSGNQGTLNNMDDLDWVASGAMTPFIPLTPKEFKTIEIANSRINLQWVDEAFDETSYKVERSDDGGATYSEIASLPAGTESYDDNTVAPGNAYWYRVRAVNELGASAYTNAKFAGTFIAPHNTLDFDGTDDYVSVPDNDALSFGNGATDQPFSVEAWVKLDNLSSRAIVSKRAGQDEYHMVISSGGQLNVTLADASAAAFLFGETSGFTFNTGQWYHLAFTYDGSGLASGIALFIDGVSQVNNPGSSGTYTAMENTNSNLEIGTVNSGATFNMDGQIDEVRIWSDVRTPLEIQENRYNTLSPLEDNLVAYYRFDQGIADGTNTGITLLPDRGIGQNNGILNGFALTGVASNWTASNAMSSGGVPDAPSGLFAVNLDQHNINIGWVDNANDETGFEIQRAEVGGSYTTVTTVAANAIEYIDHTAEADKTYKYRINAVNNTGASTFSNESYASTFHHPGRALTFDGVDDYIDVPNAPILEMPGAFTVEFWFNTTDTGNKVILEKGSANAEYSVQQFSGNVLGINVGGGILRTANSYNDGLWHHIAIVYRSAGDGDIYVDGVRDVDTNVTNTPSYSATNLHIGSRGGSLAFNGSLDEIRIWAEARTQEDVVSRKDERLAGDEINLAAYYTFDQPTGTLAVDFSETGENHGTLTGGLTFDANAPVSGAIAPQGLNVRELSGNEIWIEWTDNTFDKTGFTIESSLTPGFEVVDATYTTGDNFFINNVSPGTQQFYRVQAERSGAVLTGFSAARFGATLTPPGHALDFDGIDDFVDLGSTAGLKPNAGFTLELWLKTKTMAEMTILSARQSSGEIAGYAIRTSADGNAEVLVALDDNASWDIQLLSDNPLNQDQWYHLALVFSPGDTKFYIDGVQQIAGSSVVGTPFFDASPVRIGGDSDGFFFNGTVDELRVWNIAKTEQEIQDNRFNPVSNPAEEYNLTAYYRFDQGRDTAPSKDVNTEYTVLPDRSMNQSNGTLVNFTLDDNANDNISNWAKSGAMNSNADPAAPSDVWITTNQDEEVVLTWVDNAIDETHYEIVRASDYAFSAGVQSLATLPANTTTYTDNAVSPETQYYYRVEAVNPKSAQATSPEYFFHKPNSAGQSLSFDGIDDEVVIPTLNTDNVQQTGVFTFEFWMKANDLVTENQTLLSTATGTLDNGFFITLNNTGFPAGSIRVAIVRGQSGQYVINANTVMNFIDDTNWHHIALVGDGTNLTIYKDGIATSLGTFGAFAVASATDNLGVGGHSSAAGSNFNGELDELKIWNVTRTEQEILQLQYAPIAQNIGGLQAYYKFDQLNPSDTKLMDRSAATHDGDWLGVASGNLEPNWVESGAMAPQVPSNLYTEGSDGTSIVLHWTDNSSNESGFVIEKSIDGSFSVPDIYEVGPDETTYIDTDFEFSGYFYRVYAKSPTGNSEPTNVKWGSLITGPANALALDGIDDHVILPENPLGNGYTGNFTLEAWVKPTNLTALNPTYGAGIFRSINSESIGDYFLGINQAGSVTFAYWDAAGNDPDGLLTSDGTVAENEWTHIAATYNGTEQKIFINGVEQTGTAGATSSGWGSSTEIGRLYTTSGYFFQGEVDEVKIWNEAKLGSEIEMNRFYTALGDEIGLTAYYRFNQGNAGLNNTGFLYLPDRSKFLNDGTLTNVDLTGTTSNWVASGAMAPDAPSGLTALETGVNTVTLSWTNNAVNATGFKISRTTDAGGLQNEVVYFVGQGTTSFVDNTLAGNTGYFYRVFAVNDEDSFSAPSNLSFGSSIGAPGNTLDFDGTDDYVLVPADASQEITNYTFSLWAKINAQPVADDGFAFLQKGQIDTNPNGFFFGYFNDAGVYKLYLAHVDISSTPHLFTPEHTIAPGEWHHYAAKYDGATMEILVDGVSIGSVAQTNDPNYTINEPDLKIGASQATGGIFGAFMNGQIDELRIWSLARSNFDIQIDMNNTIRGDESNLVAYYRFDQGKAGQDNLSQAVNLLPDRSLLTNDGMLNNFDLTTETSNWVTSGAMPPAAPTDLYITELGGVDIQLDWTDVAADEDEYVIERSDLDNQNFNEIAVLPANSQTYTDTSIPADSRYYYRVRARNAKGISNPSNEKFGTTVSEQGNALDFDGTDDFVEIPNSSLFDLGATFALEAWIKTTDGLGEIINNFEETGVPNEGFTFVIGDISGDIADGIPRLYVSDGVNFETIASDLGTINDGQWHHLAVSYDGSTVTFYMDRQQGSAQPAMGYTVGSSTNVVRIGRDNNASPTRFFTGSMDEIRVWRAPRTQEDILSHMYTPLSGSELDLVAYYRFDQASADGNNTGFERLPDRSQNQNDGTLKGPFGLTSTSSNWVGSGALAIPPYLVLTTNDSGPGSLRQAITNANSSGSKETIVFDISDNGPWIISLESPLPTIDNAGNVGVIIDATTQPGWDMDAGLMVALDGSVAGGIDGIVVNEPNVEIYGLLITNFSNGIQLNANASGIAIGAPTKGNVISNNSLAGINISGINGGTIQSNRIGTSMDGLSPDGNTRQGIRINSGQNITIGGDSGLGEGNLISSNGSSTWAGLQLDAGATNINIYGNLIGTDKNGNNDLGNAYSISITSSNDINIGSMTSGHRNVIAGAAFNDEIRIAGTSPGNIIIQNNIIGLNSAGNTAIDSGDGSGVNGVGIGIGSPVTLAGIQIVDNTISGLSGTAVSINGPITNDTKIRNNFIGTNSTGTGTGTGLANKGTAIYISATGTDNNTGRIEITNNVVSGNGDSGALDRAISVQSSTNILVQNNKIGVETDGTTPYGNIGHGIYMLSATNIQVDGNTIAYNGQDGIFFDNRAAANTGVEIGINSYFCNSGLGINFETDPATVNPPEITVLNSGEISGTSAVDGEINIYEINESCADNQGAVHVATVTASGGTWSHASAINDALTFVATVTDPSDGISEFSAAFNAPPEVVISSSDPNPANTSPILVEFSFTEQVTGFTPGDVTITNATVSTLNTEDNILFTADITPTADGEITIQLPAAVVQDLSGIDNLESTVFSINYDGTAPEITGLTLTPDNSTVFINLSENVYANTGATGDLVDADISLSISGGKATLGPTSLSHTAGSNQFQVSIIYSGTPDGSEVLTVLPVDGASVYDAAGNAMSVVQSNNTITLNDQAAPEGYLVTIDNPEISQAQPLMTFQIGSGELGATFNYEISSDADGNVTKVTGSGTISDDPHIESGVDVSTLGDGELLLSVTLTDGSGNEGIAETATVFKDVTPPAGYSVTVNNSAISQVESTLAFDIENGEINAFYDYEISSDADGNVTKVTGNGTVSDNPTILSGIDVATLGDGELQIQVVLSDETGNIGVPVIANLTKDTQEPTSYTLVINNSAVTTQEPTLSFDILGGEIGTTYSYEISSSADGNLTKINNSGTVSTQPQTVSGIDVSILGDGELSVSLVLTDGVGNKGISESGSVIKDTTPPAGYSVSISNTIINVAQPLLDFEINGGEAGAAYSYEISSSADGNVAKVPGSGTISNDPQLISGVDVSVLGDGELTLELKLTDDLGNEGFLTNAFVTKDVTPPTVLSVTPSVLTITDAEVGAGTFSIVVVYDESMDIGVNIPTFAFAQDVSATLTLQGGIFTNGTLPNDTYTATYNVADANEQIDLIDVTIENGRDAADNIQNVANETAVFSINTTNPEITVTGLGLEIVSGDNTPSPTDDTDFGDLYTALGQVTKTYTISNDGTADLVLGIDAVSITGSLDFVVIAQPDQVVNPAGNASFTIAYDATEPGIASANVTIANNDADESPYTFDIAGNGLASTIEISTPIANDQVELNQPVEIAWSETGIDTQSTLTIELSLDGGGSFPEVITTGLSEALAGSFLWTPTNPAWITNSAILLVSGSGVEGLSAPFEIIPPAPVITVLSPQGGEVFKQNTDLNITFNTENLDSGDQLTFEFSANDGASWQPLGNGLVGDLQGNFTAFLDYQTFLPGVENRIRIRSEAQGIVAGHTDVFTILQGDPEITIASLPVGGGNVQVDTKNQVIYQFSYDVTVADATPTGLTLDIQGSASAAEFDVNGFKLYQNTTNDFNTAVLVDQTSYGSASATAIGFALADVVVAETTQYYWVTADISADAVNSDFSIVAPLLDNFQFEVANKADGGVGAGPAFIIQELVNQEITLLSPVGAEQVVQNTEFTISWTTSGFEGNETIQVEYSANGGANWTVLVSDAAATLNGSYSWFVDEFNFGVNTDSKIRVRTDTNSATSESQTPFEIVAPDPTVNIVSQPISAKNLIQGSSDNIIAHLKMDATAADAPVEGILFRVEGAAQAADFQVDGFKLYSNEENNFATATQLGGGVSFGNFGANQVGVEFVQTIPRDATAFYWLTVDIEPDASLVAFNLAKPVPDDFGLGDAEKILFVEASANYTIVPSGSPQITVNTPQGGAVFEQGELVLVEFTTANFTGDPTLVIEYSSNGGANWSAIATNTASGFGGTFNWQTGAAQVVGSDYKLRVRADDNSALGESTGTFSITSPPKALTLIRPDAAGITIHQNSTYTIQWTTENFVGTETLIIEHSANSGANFSTVASATASSFAGKYQWFVDANAFDQGTTHRIRVRTGDGSIVATSANDFTIAEPIPPTLALTSPNDATGSIEQNSTFAITWDANHFVGTENLFVEFSSNNGKDWAVVKTGTVAGLNGSVNWFVDNEIYPAGAQNQIRIRTANNNLISTSPVFEITAPNVPVITINTPNGGEVIAQNSTHKILFVTTGIPRTQSLVIEYATDNTHSVWARIASGLVGQFEGEYSWKVEKSKYPVSGNYKIRIRTEDGVTQGTSANAFSVIPPQPTLALLTPNGNERIQQNSTYAIEWQAANFVGPETLIIEYASDGGLSDTWTFIAQGTVASFNGRYDWFVDPADYPVGDNYKIRVRNTSASALGVSAQNFKVIPKAIKSILVGSPNGGEQLEQNSTALISWTTSNFIGSETLVVEYTTGSTWIELTSGTADHLNGTYNWFIDQATYGVAVGYEVRVRTLDFTVLDKSNAPFEVVAPASQALTLINPVGGEQIAQNSTYKVSFDVSGFAASDVLRVEYTTNGTAWTTITSKTVGELSGKYNWFVDDQQYPVGSTYQLRVIDNATGTVQSQSPAFEIVIPVVTPRITVSAPNIPEQLTLNSTYEILWSTQGLSDNTSLIVEYSSDGGLTHWDLLTSGTISSLKGRFSWFIDEQLYDVGASNKIRVRTSDNTVKDSSNEFFEIIAPTEAGFNIISPNGGEVITQNTTVDVLFNTLGLPDNEEIVLEYSTDGFNWTNLAKATVALFNGQFSWYIDPAVFFPHQRYRVRVRTLDERAVDECDGLFTIEEETVPVLAITSPVAGEQIEQNSTYTIAWTGQDFKGTEELFVEYTANDGANWLQLTTATAAELSGEYVWFVDPAQFPVGQSYKVRVRGSDARITDETESTIQIVAPVNLSLTLDAPNDAVSIEQNSTYKIKFSSAGLAASEVLELEWSTDGTNWSTITSQTVGDLAGTYDWLVDEATYPLGSTYQVRVRNASNNLEDVSDSPFSIIEEKVITVLNPNGGEKIDQERNFTITFSTSGLADDTELVLEYSVNGGLFWNTLTQATLAELSGSFDWFVDRAGHKAANTYSVRVRTADGKVADTSNEFFEVIAPVATAATKVGSFGFTANWDSYPEATEYLLDVSTTASFESFVAGFEGVSITARTLPVQGLYHGKTYYYRVRAKVDTDYTTPVSNIIAVKLPVSSLLKSDSTALAGIYAATGGDFWKNNNQWLSGNVNQWHGITVTDGRVTAIDLVDNNLTGEFPSIETGLEKLTRIDVRDNTLEKMGDQARLITDEALTEVNITGNMLDFAALDAIPDLVSNGAYQYNPQALLLKEEVIVAESTSSVDLNRLIGGTGNQYQWYKDGEEVSGEVDPDLGIVPLPFLIYEIHDGAYHVEVTNPSYTGLTLKTTPVHLRISSLERDSLALLAIYDAMDGANWTGTIRGWRRDNTTKVKNWTGVVDGGNRIVRINLPNRGLKNEMPRDLADITGLKSIDISGNAVTGLPDITSLKKLESVNVSNNKLEFDDFERNLDLLDKMTVGTQNPFGGPIAPVKAKAGIDYEIKVDIGGQYNEYKWERKPYVLYGAPKSFAQVADETETAIVLENLRFDNMGTYRCEITNPKVPGLTLVSNEELVIGTVDLQGKVFDSDGQEVHEGDIGIMSVRNLGTKYDSLFNPKTNTPIFKVGLDGYIIRDVPLGDYMIGVRSDPEKYIQTYYVSDYEWLEADTLKLRDKKGQLNINITNIPVPDPGNLGDGTFSGTFEEDDGIENGRTLGRRRVKKRGCALKRRRGSGRGNADEVFDLYAYVETNDQGEFEFTDLIPGTYRFSIEFPGIPMDPNAYTEFVVSSDIRKENTFHVSAVATTKGVIEVELDNVTAIHEKYFGGLNIYPNPATDKLTVQYDKLKATGIHAQIIDLAGNILLDQEIQHGFQQKADLDISHIENGIYMLYFVDTNDDSLRISATKFVITR